MTPQTPPVFLVHALDDGVASANSRLMEQACREKGVPSSLHFYPSGGHGYGMEKRGQPTDKWPEAAEQWLAERALGWADVDSTFYSDSMNDVPLLEKVNHPVATNPDPRLRALAQERGWRILDLFSAPASQDAP